MTGPMALVSEFNNTVRPKGLAVRGSMIIIVGRIPARRDPLGRKTKTDFFKIRPNAHELPRIYRLLGELGLSGMLICTPVEFLGGTDHDK